MRQFETYPIFVNVPDEDAAKERQKHVDKYNKAQDFRKAAYYENVQRRKDDMTADPTPTAAGAYYENYVLKYLNIVKKVPIGRVLLDTFREDETVWIIPISPEEQHKGRNEGGCACEAYTHDSNSSKDYKGIRIYYNPGETFDNGKWRKNDDTLFHELVHAYRATIGAKREDRSLNGYENGEEFVATIMENLYVSSASGTRFLSQYNNATVVTQREAYGIYEKDAEIIKALKYFIYNDPLIWAMARRLDPPFNPWRDQPKLEKLWLRANAHLKLKQLPAY